MWVPCDKRIDDFEFTANPSVSPSVIHHLASLAWVKAGTRSASLATPAPPATHSPEQEETIRHQLTPH
jgi:hypothetical protein